MVTFKSATHRPSVRTERSYIVGVDMSCGRRHDRDTHGKHVEYDFIAIQTFDLGCMRERGAEQRVCYLAFLCGRHGGNECSLLKVPGGG